jgi:hypothetical protein
MYAVFGKGPVSRLPVPLACCLGQQEGARRFVCVAIFEFLSSGDNCYFFQ